MGEKMETIVVTITHLECNYCGQVVHSCRGCHKLFKTGRKIVCVDNPHEGTPWAYKHYCAECGADTKGR
jgi:hypothetical protein